MSADNKITIIKIGGKVLTQDELLDSFLKDLSQIEGKKIIVHGGGNLVSDFLYSINHKVQFIEGRRITDKTSLDAVIMNLAGLMNKQLVAKLQALNVNALGLSGADGNLIQAEKRPVKIHDYGFVGDVIGVNTQLLSQLLELGVTPVIASLTHDKKAQLLNTNADTLASSIAQALAKDLDISVMLNFCFDLPFVCKDINDSTSRIATININNYHKYKASGSISGGMIPKLDNCFNALDKGVKEVTISDCNELINLLKNKTFKGTKVTL